MVELNGDTAGNNLDNYDQLQVTGTVTLGNALTVSIGNAFTPIIDQQFKIIDNDGSDPVSGTFKDLPEGSLLTLGRNVLRISYVGGNGNDVVLTRVPAAFWDGVPDGGGTSANANWQTATNWVGDAVAEPRGQFDFSRGPVGRQHGERLPGRDRFRCDCDSGVGLHAERQRDHLAVRDQRQWQQQHAELADHLERAADDRRLWRVDA